MKQIWIIAQHTIKALIRKKDFYVFFMMLIMLLVLLFSENFFGVQDISRYLKDIGFFCLWLFSLIIAVTFSTKQLPEEMESKTICPLLAKPVSRMHLIVGRFLGSVLSASFAYTAFYLPYVAITFLKGGEITFSLILQSYVFGVCFLTIVCAISILLSLYFTLSAAIMLSFIFYFMVMWFADGLRVAALSLTGIRSILLTIIYYLIPHYEFYNLRIRLVHSWEALPLWVVFAVILYTATYANIILFLSYMKLKKKVL